MNNKFLAPKITKSRISQAISVALLTGILAPASSVAGSGSCAAGVNSISASTNTTCVLDTTDSLTVTSTGDIDINSFSSSGIVVTSSGNITINEGGSVDSLYAYGIYAYTDGSTIGNIVNNGDIYGDDAGVRIGTNSTGGASTVASVVNNGTIRGEENSGIYIYGANLTVTGNIENSDYLYGTGHGLYIYESAVGGSVINSGYIYADNGSGIYIYGATITGSITNTLDGYIYSEDSGIFVGAESSVGGDVENLGTIIAQDHGFYVYRTTVTGSLLNSGYISSRNDNGMYVYDSDITGSVTNQLTGTIISNDVGIFLGWDSSVGGNVQNLGTIIAQDIGMYVYETAVTGSVINSGYIYSNNDTGIYVYMANVSGDVSNTGYIYADAYGISILADSSITGDVTNTGIITSTGAEDGIYIYTGSVDGNVVNSGTIKVDSGYMYTGINISFGSVGGNVENSGEMGYTYMAGILVYGTSVEGDVINSGDMTYAYQSGIYIYSGSVIAGNVINTEDGSIYGYTGNGLKLHYSYVYGNVENAGFINAYDEGIYLYAQEVAGDVINSGTLISRDASGIYIAPGSLVHGNVLNTGDINADDRGIYVYADVEGSVINSGNIFSGDSGIGFGYDINIGGNVENQGLIVAEDSGIYVYGNEFRGDIINSGIIIANDSGIRSSYYSYVYGNVENSGRIDASDYGMYLYGDVAGDVNNSGEIKSGDGGIYVYIGADIEGSVINTGLIAADDNGIYIYGNVGGDIDNSGDIYARDTGMFVNWTGTVGGDIVNSGNIMSQYYGLYIYGNVAGDIINSGVIKSEYDAGVYLYIANDDFGGDIINDGTISSDYGYALFAQETSVGTVQNNGTMSGGVILPQVESFANAGTLNIKDSSSLIGGNYNQTSSGVLEVAAGTSGSGSLIVSGDAVFENGSTLRIDNEGRMGAFSLNNVIQAENLTATGLELQDNSLSQNFTIVTEGNSLSVEVTESGFESVTDALDQTGLQTGAGKALDEIFTENPTGEVAYSLGSLSTAKAIKDAVETTLPVLAGGLAQATLNIGNSVTNAIGVRQNQNGLSSGDETSNDKQAWLKYIVGSADQDGSNGVQGYDLDSTGIVFGMDTDVSATWNVGGAIAMIDSEVDSDSGLQMVDVDTTLIKLYANHSIGENSALSLQLGTGVAENEGERTLFNSAVARSSYDTSLTQASVDLSTKVERSEKTTYAPYVRLDYNKASVEAYNEKGAGDFNLQNKQTSSDSLIVGLGTRASHAYSDNWTFTGNLGLGLDTRAENSRIASAYQGGGSTFTTEGLQPETMRYSLGVGANYELDNGIEVSGNYDLNNRSDYSESLFSLKANYKF